MIRDKHMVIMHHPAKTIVFLMSKEQKCAYLITNIALHFWGFFCMIRDAGYIPLAIEIANIPKI
jgi:hypothetical protein